MRKNIAAGSFLVMTVVFGADLQAHERRHGGHDRGKIAGHVAEKLNLTNEQREQIRAIHERERQSTEPLRDALREKRRDYKELKRANDPRADAVKAELDVLREQARARHESVRAQVENVLTAEQRLQLQQMKEQWKEKKRKP